MELLVLVSIAVYWVREIRTLWHDPAKLVAGQIMQIPAAQPQRMGRYCESNANWCIDSAFALPKSSESKIQWGLWLHPPESRGAELDVKITAMHSDPTGSESKIRTSKQNRHS